MISLYPLIITLLTVALLSSCSGIIRQSDKPVAPIETSVAQCEDSSSTQKQDFEKLGGQVVNLNASLTMLTQKLTATNTAVEQMNNLNSDLTSRLEQIQKNSEADAIAEVALSCTDSPQFNKLMVGQEEEVWLQDLQLALPARIDTGAETASIDASDIELFDRDGKDWVRFNIRHPDTEEPLQLERVLKRQVSIVQSNTTEAERRPVIELGIALGSIKQLAEFTLSDRSHLNHQILIGRNILRDVMVVDVSQSNIAPYTIIEPVNPVLDEEIMDKQTP